MYLYQYLRYIGKVYYQALLLGCTSDVAWFLLLTVRCAFDVYCVCVLCTTVCTVTCMSATELCLVDVYTPVCR